MTRVALEAEKQTSGFNKLAMPTTFCIPSYLAKAAVRASLHLPSRAIVVDTNSGMTARTVASYRPKTNIIAMCYHKHVARELGLSFGVYAQHIQKPSDVDDFTVSAVKKLVDNKCIQATERVIFLAGSFGKKQHASFVEIITPQDVL
jgi:pyruvate kinase